MTLIQDGIRAVIVVVTFGVCLVLFGLWHDEWSGYNASLRVSDGVCNVAVIPLHGEISSYTYYDESGQEMYTSVLDDVEAALTAAERDPMIEAVLLSVDSPGGSPYAGEALAKELLRSPLPSVALVRDQGLSAGYWAATGADHLIASALSDIGSIGVTMSYVEYAGQQRDSGLSYIEIASGKYKDAGNPDRFLTEEERALFQRDVDLVHEEFVKAVAEHRGMSTDAVRALADGSSMTGAAALTAGLIDAMGDKETAREWIAGQIGLPVEEVILCE